MATTNLISKSLGDSLTSAGNGTPDHISPRGSTYVNNDTGIIYTQLNNNWVDINYLSYGQMSLNSNITNTVVTVANTWYPLRTLNWSATTTGTGVTFSGSPNSVLVINRPGKYFVTGNATFEIVAAVNGFYELGITKNLSFPIIGYYMGCSTDNVETTPNVGISGYFQLSVGDTIELSIRNTLNTNDALVTNANLTIFKIGNNT